MRVTSKWMLPCVLLASCQSSTDANDTRVASIAFAVPVISISQGESQALAVTFADADGRALHDVTGATWTSDNTNVVAVTQSGAAQGISLGGPVDVTVTVDGVSATVAITTVPERIRFTPADSTLVLGQTLEFSGVLEDHHGATISSNAPITWGSSNPAIASVDPATGLVTSAGAGYTSISATAAGRTSTRTLQVGTPSQYDGRWTGTSTTAALGGSGSVGISFHVIFGDVRGFTMLLQGGSSCGPVSATAQGPIATISNDAFTLMVTPSPTFAGSTAPNTVSATFSSATQLGGTHTAIGWGSLATCPIPGTDRSFFSVGGAVGAATFAATKAPN